MGAIEFGLGIIGVVVALLGIVLGAIQNKGRLFKNKIKSVSAAAFLAIVAVQLLAFLFLAHGHDP